LAALVPPAGTISIEEIDFHFHIAGATGTGPQIKPGVRPGSLDRRPYQAAARWEAASQAGGRQDPLPFGEYSFDAVNHVSGP
jgi:hypothetical protein